jgi:hypothetical protein
LTIGLGRLFLFTSFLPTSTEEQMRIKKIVKSSKGLCKCKSSC